MTLQNVPQDPKQEYCPRKCFDGRHNPRRSGTSILRSTAYKSDNEVSVVETEKIRFTYHAEIQDIFNVKVDQNS